MLHKTICDMLHKTICDMLHKTICDMSHKTICDMLHKGPLINMLLWIVSFETIHKLVKHKENVD